MSRCPIATCWSSLASSNLFLRALETSLWTESTTTAPNLVKTWQTALGVVGGQLSLRRNQQCRSPVSSVHFPGLALHPFPPVFVQQQVAPKAPVLPLRKSRNARRIIRRLLDPYVPLNVWLCAKETDALLSCPGRQTRANTKAAGRRAIDTVFLVLCSARFSRPNGTPHCRFPRLFCGLFFVSIFWAKPSGGEKSDAVDRSKEVAKMHAAVVPNGWLVKLGTCLKKKMGPEKKGKKGIGKQQMFGGPDTHEQPGFGSGFCGKRQPHVRLVRDRWKIGFGERAEQLELCPKTPLLQRY